MCLATHCYIHMGCVTTLAPLSPCRHCGHLEISAFLMAGGNEFVSLIAECVLTCHLVGILKLLDQHYKQELLLQLLLHRVHIQFSVV